MSKLFSNAKTLEIFDFLCSEKDVLYIIEQKFNSILINECDDLKANVV